MNQSSDNPLSLDFKFNLKTLIVILLFAVGLYFLFPKLIGVPEALKLILHVNKWYLVLALICELLSYVGAATLLGVILQALGYNVGLYKRFKISSIAAFAIHFFPVGSFGEGAVNYYFLRKEKVEAGSILLMLALRIIFTYASFLLLFLYGLALVPTVPHLEVSPKIVSLVIFILIAGLAIYLFYLYKHKDKFRKTWNKFLRFLDNFASRIRGKEISQAKESEVFEDIYSGIGLFSKKKRSSLYALLAGIMYWMGDIACFYFVFLSFGYHISWGVLIFGYGAASLLGMASFIPGGLGVVEGTMGLMYSGLGVPSSLALMSILVFRFFSFWIWIPFGLYSFISMGKEKKKSGNENLSNFQIK
ncbi:MAG: hypothetical protein UT28_C0001G0793 [Berkelbacteria bacterium GW2011_GWE1_39_12]|uniref:Integral membrane protein n=1 Tax=Berkelbacteria bacterium GW2011_GWE1_39_12 TaxID=1618337 RepID=A0A0G4B579_9BACT|nr:MAG: hypothetical protein UT28_C0001G0793 [Berkelbacteria bacterium GW2011_GWE1_39_12]